VSVRLLDAIFGGLDLVGRVLPAAKTKAELARIGQYYATESILVWNVETRAYDSAGTPWTGTDTLQNHYKRLIEGKSSIERGKHSVL
jgi:divinyl chlorophyllide a 8-vinyl-reductase